MKSRAKARNARRTGVEKNDASAFSVPNHGRLVRRGSTEVTDETNEAPGGPKAWSGASR
jgi:hypothetical protein